jgi:hypothetical protein
MLPKKIKTQLALLYTTLMLAPSSHAANQAQLPPLPKPDLLPGPTDVTGQNNPEQVQSYFLDNLLPMASQRLVTIIALLSIVSLFYAGYKYYTAFGDEQKAEEGKKIATYAIVGLVLSLMSLAIVSIIGGFAQFFQQ